ncbi:MAG: 50S ribosomal protein L18, partial [Candidatus Gastranaerophilales bacterium]|nr:50S ribosomal protein L18 [Candidatus Gastranaerophilales bacterium]
MIKQINKKEATKKRHQRLRAKLSGTAASPRLAIYRSTKHI